METIKAQLMKSEFFTAMRYNPGSILHTIIAKVLMVIYCCCYVAMAGEFGNGVKSRTTPVTLSPGAAHSTGESSTANNTSLSDHTGGKGRVIALTKFVSLQASSVF